MRLQPISEEGWRGALANTTCPKRDGTISSGWLLGSDFLSSMFPGAHHKSRPVVPFANRMSCDCMRNINT